ncbi:flagellar basal body-associated FliL family protein [Halopseudomonas pertucinogena]|uniref:Flagellar protein FliL n=1 Tax=Halopseudomonas pertucinogena TaxID=86175 RepID=A0ABQ2CSM7_9GAMM|nr:flagellar basal body-associated FliL family protein [Halopseudomonas pertucinogena]GGI98505.1 flagellar basal body-associated protein FliL [Halopseudomonas pertucinogena]
MARNQAGAQQPAPQAVSEKKRMPLVLIGVGLLALLLSIGGLAYALLSGKESPAESASEPARLPALYQPLDPAFTVNYAHGGRQRYMQVNVVLMGRDPKAMAAAAEHSPLIRNQLVMLFSGADFEQLMSAEGKEQLREQATLAVQTLMEQEIGGPTIESVLFTNLVLQ